MSSEGSDIGLYYVFDREFDEYDDTSYQKSMLELRRSKLCVLMRDFFTWISLFQCLFLSFHPCTHYYKYSFFRYLFYFCNPLAQVDHYSTIMIFYFVFLIVFLVYILLSFICSFRNKIVSRMNFFVECLLIVLYLPSLFLVFIFLQCDFGKNELMDVVEETLTLETGIIKCYSVDGISVMFISISMVLSVSLMSFRQFMYHFSVKSLFSSPSSLPLASFQILKTCLVFWSHNTITRNPIIYSSGILVMNFMILLFLFRMIWFYNKVTLFLITTILSISIGLNISDIFYHINGSKSYYVIGIILISVHLLFLIRFVFQCLRNPLCFLFPHDEVIYFHYLPFWRKKKYLKGREKKLTHKTSMLILVDQFFHYKKKKDIMGMKITRKMIAEKFRLYPNMRIGVEIRNKVFHITHHTNIDLVKPPSRKMMSFRNLMDQFERRTSKVSALQNSGSNDSSIFLKDKFNSRLLHEFSRLYDEMMYMMRKIFAANHVGVLSYSEFFKIVNLLVRSEKRVIYLLGELEKINLIKLSNITKRDRYILFLRKVSHFYSNVLGNPSLGTRYSRLLGFENVLNDSRNTQCLPQAENSERRFASGSPERLCYSSDLTYSSNTSNDSDTDEEEIVVDREDQLRNREVVLIEEEKAELGSITPSTVGGAFEFEFGSPSSGMDETGEGLNGMGQGWERAREKEGQVVSFDDDVEENDHDDDSNVESHENLEEFDLEEKSEEENEGGNEIGKEYCSTSKSSECISKNQLKSQDFARKKIEKERNCNICCFRVLSLLFSLLVLGMFTILVVVVIVKPTKYFNLVSERNVFRSLYSPFSLLKEIRETQITFHHELFENHHHEEEVEKLEVASQVETQMEDFESFCESIDHVREYYQENGESSEESENQVNFCISETCIDNDIATLYSYTDILHFYVTTCFSLRTYILSVAQEYISNSTESVVDDDDDDEEEEEEIDHEHYQRLIKYLFLNTPNFIDELSHLMINNASERENTITVQIVVYFIILILIVAFSNFIFCFCFNLLELNHQRLYLFFRWFIPKEVSYRIFKDIFDGDERVFLGLEEKEQNQGMTFWGRCTRRQIMRFECKFLFFWQLFTFLVVLFSSLICWNIWSINSQIQEIQVIDEIYPRFSSVVFFASEIVLFPATQIEEHDDCDLSESYPLDSFFTLTELRSELTKRLPKLNEKYKLLKDSMTSTHEDYPYQIFCDDDEVTEEEDDESEEEEEEEVTEDGDDDDDDDDYPEWMVMTCKSLEEKMRILNEIASELLKDTEFPPSNYSISDTQEVLTYFEFFEELEDEDDGIIYSFIHLSDVLVLECWTNNVLLWFVMDMCTIIVFFIFIMFLIWCCRKTMELENRFKRVKKFFLLLTKKELEEYRIREILHSRSRDFRDLLMIFCGISGFGRNSFIISTGGGGGERMVRDVFKIKKKKLYELHEDNEAYVIILYNLKCRKIIFFNECAKKRFSGLEKEFVSSLEDIFPQNSLEVLNSFLFQKNNDRQHKNNDNDISDDEGQSRKKKRIGYFCENLVSLSGVVFNVTATKVRNECMIIMRDVAFENEQRLLLEQERNTSDLLLANILPKKVIESLKNSKSLSSSSEIDRRNVTFKHKQCTFLFSDLVGFTSYCSKKDAESVVMLLNSLVSAIDRLSPQYSVEKIKTIGDCWFGVCGGLEYIPNHAERMFEFAIKIFDCLESTNLEFNSNFKFRTGIHTGPAVSGVIGEKKYAYDFIGDSVNFAARMEHTGVPDCIQVSRKTYTYLHRKYEFKEREVYVKGKGRVRAYLFKVGSGEIKDDYDASLEEKLYNENVSCILKSPQKVKKKKNNDEEKEEIEEEEEREKNKGFKRRKRKKNVIVLNRRKSESDISSFEETTEEEEPLGQEKKKKIAMEGILRKLSPKSKISKYENDIFQITQQTERNQIDKVRDRKNYATPLSPSSHSMSYLVLSRLGRSPKNLKSNQ